MLNDFDLITHAFPGEVTIYPVGDVHLGAIEHQEQEWQAFLKRVEAENAYIILLGDLLNNNIRSCKFANPFDEILRPREAKARMMNYLEPLAKRILLATGGNHERRTERETDNDLTRDIMVKLDLEHLYRPNIAFMTITTGKRPNHERAECSFNFAVTHGAGGGFLTGAAVNRAERFGGMAIDGLDCLIVGHTHKPFTTTPAKIVIDARNRVVMIKSYTVVSCTSWLQYGGYAARAMLTPTTTSKPQKLILSADHHNKEITVITKGG